MFRLIHGARDGPVGRVSNPSHDVLARSSQGRFHPICAKLVPGGVCLMGDTLSLMGKGALAGATATICMSALMLLSKRLGVQGEHPPKRITETLLRKAGSDHPPAVNVLSTAAHLAFGAGSGSLFTLLRQNLQARQLPGLQGMAFASLIWLVSYKGWVPALRILPPVERDRPGRVVTMLAAHLVYGAVLGELAARWACVCGTGLKRVSQATTATNPLSGAMPVSGGRGEG